MPWDWGFYSHVFLLLPSFYFNSVWPAQIGGGGGVVVGWHKLKIYHAAQTEPARYFLRPNMIPRSVVLSVAGAASLLWTWQTDWLWGSTYWSGQNIPSPTASTHVCLALVNPPTFLPNPFFSPRKSPLLSLSLYFYFYVCKKKRVTPSDLLFHAMHKWQCFEAYEVFHKLPVSFCDLWLAFSDSQLIFASPMCELSTLWK